MLNGLDDIQWQNLEHAYGAATDVPVLLRALLSENPEERSKAIYELYGSIWHQGTVYEATQYAVPFLIELVGSERVLDRDQILVLLADLACGHSYQAVHQHLIRDESKRNTPQSRAQIEKEMGWVSDAHTAVGKGLPSYLTLLESTDAKIRASSAYLLATLKEYAGQIVPALRRCLGEEQEPSCLVSILLSLESLAEGSEEIVPHLARFLRHRKPMVRAAAAMALAGVARERAPEEVAVILLDCIAKPGDLEDEYADLPWSSRGLMADASKFLATLTESAQARAIPVLVKAMNKSRSLSALYVAGALLHLAFGEPLPQPPENLPQLTAMQRDVLAAISAGKSVWALRFELPQLLALYGLPQKREDLQTFVKERST